MVSHGLPWSPVARPERTVPSPKSVVWPWSPVVSCGLLWQVAIKVLLRVFCRRGCHCLCLLSFAWKPYALWRVKHCHCRPHILTGNWDTTPGTKTVGDIFVIQCHPHRPLSNGGMMWCFVECRADLSLHWRSSRKYACCTQNKECQQM